MSRPALTDRMLVGLANIAVDLIDDPEFSPTSLADNVDIVRSGRRHNGILPGEALEQCHRTIERYGLTWVRGRGWVRS